MLYIISYIPYNMQWGPNGIIRTNGMPLIYQKSGIRINISISMRLILILASGNTRIIPKVRWIFSAHSLNIYTKLIFSVKSCGRKKNILLYIQCSLRCCRRYQRDNSSGDGFLSDYSTDMYHGISTILGWQSTFIWERTKAKIYIWISEQCLGFSAWLDDGTSCSQWMLAELYCTSDFSTNHTHKSKWLVTLVLVQQFRKKTVSVTDDRLRINLNLDKIAPAEHGAGMTSLTCLWSTLVVPSSLR